MLLLYVDDIILTGSCSLVINKLITQLQFEFSLKDLGSLHYFLGVEVKYVPDGLFLSQEKYLKDIIHRAGMDECKPSATPVAVKSSSSPTNNGPFHDPTLYKSLVGSLQYLTITRPEITFAVNSTCQAMHRPSNADYSSVKRIIRYLKSTIYSGLHYRKSPLVLQAFSDSDWATNPLDRRSITGSCIFLGQNPISWTTQKQRSVAKSSTEAEYKAMAFTAQDLAWLTMLLRDLHIS